MRPCLFLSAVRVVGETSPFHHCPRQVMYVPFVAGGVHAGAAVLVGTSNSDHPGLDREIAQHAEAAVLTLNASLTSPPLAERGQVAVTLLVLTAPERRNPLRLNLLIHVGFLSVRCPGP